MISAYLRKVLGREAKKQINELQKHVTDQSARFDRAKKEVQRLKVDTKERLRLYNEGLPIPNSEERELAEDEMKCAFSDLIFAKRLLEQHISAALPIDTMPNEEHYRSTFEEARKLKFEKLLGKPLEWNEYWKMLDNWYIEQEDLEEERYDECVRAYVHRLDSGRKDGRYDSDDGAHTYRPHGLRPATGRTYK